MSQEDGVVVVGEAEEDDDDEFEFEDEVLDNGVAMAASACTARPAPPVGPPPPARRRSTLLLNAAEAAEAAARVASAREAVARSRRDVFVRVLHLGVHISTIWLCMVVAARAVCPGVRPHVHTRARTHTRARSPVLGSRTARRAPRARHTLVTRKCATELRRFRAAHRTASERP